MSKYRPRAHRPVDMQRLKAELRGQLMDDAPAVLHALTCRSCGLRATAVRALALCDWNEDQFVEAYWLEVVSEL